MFWQIFHDISFGHNQVTKITAILDFKETLSNKDIASTARMTIARIFSLFILQSLTAEKKNNNVGNILKVSNVSSA